MKGFVCWFKIGSIQDRQTLFGLETGILNLHFWNPLAPIRSTMNVATIVTSAVLINAITFHFVVFFFLM